MLASHRFIYWWYRRSMLMFPHKSSKHMLTVCRGVFLAGRLLWFLRASGKQTHSDEGTWEKTNPERVRTNKQLIKPFRMMDSWCEIYLMLNATRSEQKGLDFHPHRWTQLLRALYCLQMLPMMKRNWLWKKDTFYRGLILTK